MTIDIKKWRFCCLALGLLAAVILLPENSISSSASGPATLEDDFDDSIIIGSEIWRVWTQFNVTDEDIMFDRIIGEYISEPQMVNFGNNAYDMDASINTCNACMNENEKLWVVWERLNTHAGDPMKSPETDIVFSIRSIGTAWETEGFPHYSNNYDDINPDVYGDSE